LTLNPAVGCELKMVSAFSMVSKGKLNDVALANAAHDLIADKLE
jgi:hypothetical protein